MNSILFYGYEWTGLLPFLSGPAAFLILFWAVLDKQKKRRAAGLVAGFFLAGVFLLSAMPVNYGELTFDEELSSLSVQDALQQSLDRAEREGRPVLYYFHADWCTHCHELEHRLSRQSTLDQLDAFLLVSIDVTHEKAFAQANSSFGLNQVPALAFANRHGKRLPVLLEGAHFPQSALLDILHTLGE
ncbi:MAG: thioredoxin family protein [Leptospiraceae bacterium]|nr:thioredoxin family protein [Leptospiraceae bacterium]